MITAENISYHIGRKEILQHISVTVKPGELLAIMGTNGAGKSTLLRTLSGELKPTTGNVLIGGKNMAHWHPRELARVKAVLPQHTSLTLPFQVQEVVMMGRYPHFNSREQETDREIVALAMQKTGTDHLAQRVYTELSGGEQQRVHLARVFAQIGQPTSAAPHYLLLDEPVNSLDVRYQHHTLQLARDYARAGNCVVVVLHDLNLAALYADKVLLLKKGKITALETPAQIMTDDIITDTFGYPACVEKHPHLDCPVVYFGQHLYEKSVVTS